MLEPETTRYDKYLRLDVLLSTWVVVLSQLLRSCSSVGLLCIGECISHRGTYKSIKCNRGPGPSRDCNYDSVRIIHFSPPLEFALIKDCVGISGPAYL